ncbi:MAG: N-acetylmannosamine-6-phosphate 2-epimerase [Phototrophicaceae bacterium]
MITIESFIEQVRGRLIVSCQALADEPLHGAHIMARMAIAAQEGGATAIRANSPDDIRAIRQAVSLPIIGLYKDGDSGVYITPTRQHAQAIIEAGADIIALDATQQQRADGESIEAIINLIHSQNRLVLADVSTFDEAKHAVSLRADFVAPTLSGYTAYSPKLEGPDYELIQTMAQLLNVPVIAEGRIRTPQEAKRALECGALSVVVGSAITRPQLITASFVEALK